MISVDAIIGGISCLAGCIGTVIAWKTYRNTDSISQTVAEAIHQDRIYAEQPELLSAIEQCALLAEVWSPSEPLPSNLYSGLTYICHRLEDLLSDQPKKLNNVKRLISRLTPLRTAGTHTNANLKYEYLDIIEEIRSMIKTGRS